MLCQTVNSYLNGWVGIYPSEGPQDEEFGSAIARLIPGYVLRVLVHDDDVFAHWLYRDGILINSFLSRPGYFDDKNKAADEAMSGDPRAFLPLASNSEKTLAKLFDRSVPRPTFEVETLLNFGKALGIGNIATSYEYLQNGERDGIKGWRQFVELPRALAEEAAAKEKAKKLAVTAEIQRLKKAGVLLGREERKTFPGDICSVGDGFLISWHHMVPTRAELLQFKAPWGKPKPTTLPAPSSWCRISSDARGRRIALSTNKIEIWDWSNEQWRHATDVAAPSPPFAASILPKGDMVSFWLGQQFNVVDIDTGKTVIQFSATSEPRQTVLHPSSKWLVGLNPAENAFEIVELSSGTRRLLYLNINTQVEQQRAENQRAIQTYSENPSGQDLSRELAGATDRQLNRMRADLMEKRDKKLPIKTGYSNAGLGAIGFTPDGSWMKCGATAGTLLFHWTDFLAAQDAETPEPKWIVRTSGTDSKNFPAHFTTTAAEADGQSLLMGDSLGRLHRFSLHDGSQYAFFQMPGNPTIAAVLFSDDHSKIAVQSRTRAEDGLNVDKYIWDVFDYAKLIEFGESKR